MACGVVCVVCVGVRLGRTPKVRKNTLIQRWKQSVLQICGRWSGATVTSKIFECVRQPLLDCIIRRRRVFNTEPMRACPESSKLANGAESRGIGRDCPKSCWCPAHLHRRWRHLVIELVILQRPANRADFERKCVSSMCRPEEQMMRRSGTSASQMRGMEGAACKG